MRLRCFSSFRPPEYSRLFRHSQVTMPANACTFERVGGASLKLVAPSQPSSNCALSL